MARLPPDQCSCVVHKLRSDGVVEDDRVTSWRTSRKTSASARAHKCQITIPCCALVQGVYNDMQHWSFTKLEVFRTRKYPFNSIRTDIVIMRRNSPTEYEPLRWWQYAIKYVFCFKYRFKWGVTQTRCCTTVRNSNGQAIPWKMRILHLTNTRQRMCCHQVVIIAIFIM